jgi:hypothetical protein
MGSPVMLVGFGSSRLYADDIRIEDEEWRVIFREDIACQGERAGGAKRFGLNGKCDSDIVFLFILFGVRHVTDRR